MTHACALHVTSFDLNGSGSFSESAFASACIGRRAVPGARSPSFPGLHSPVLPRDRSRGADNIQTGRAPNHWVDVRLRRGESLAIATGKLPRPGAPKLLLAHPQGERAPPHAGARRRVIDAHGRVAPTEKHDLHRVEQDAEVESGRLVLDVVEVVPHLLRLLLEIVGVAVADLRPARDAGPDRGAQRVVR